MPNLKELTEILDNNPEFAKDYFLKNASPKLIEQWVMRRSSRLSVGVNKVNKISRSCTDIVLKPLTNAPSNAKLDRILHKDNSALNLGARPEERKKKTVEELSSLNEKDLLMELIRDIAYELDVDSLSHKILVNVSILTNGDRCSLFLVQGHKDRKYLVSRLFDVTTESTVQDAVKPLSKAIIIPVGVGIAGHAAATGEIINIKDAYKDPRFNPAIDKDTGYKTNSILCMPIKNQYSEVIGVAQIINKKQGDQVFTKKDEMVFENYLTFCGIGLTNAQLFDASVNEYKRNQVLLSLAKNIFEDTECLETVVRRIMNQAQDLVQCERCTVYLLKQNIPIDDKEQIQFSHVFDLIHNQEETENVIEDYWKNMAGESANDRTVYSGFARLVAETGEVLNMDNFSKEETSQSDSTEEISELDDTFKPKCMLCSPILNNQQEIIGVAQLLNKIDGHSFDDNDETIFEGFAIFCGLGIHNTQMFEKASLMLARQKVNMEVLQYHAGVGDVDIEELENAVIPDDDPFGLQTFEFDDLIMSDMKTCEMSIKMFVEKDLLRKFNIPHKKMCSFILTVKKNYRPVTYHNWRHAFNVAQTMFSLLTTGQMFSWFTDLEALVLIVACLCHDLDHRGTNNTFQVKAESAIARLYGTSTMERHHFDHSVMILKSDGSDIFTSLNESDYKTAMKLLEDAILSTDLALYFKKRADFQNLVESKLADWSQFENRGVLRGMMMTACDVAAITKPWEIQQRVAELVASEFFEQGDLEREEFSTVPMPMMDREKHNDLPKMQVGFIDFVCMPIYKVFYHINPLLKPLYDGCVTNKKNWQNMVDTYEPTLENALKDSSQETKTTTETHNERKNSKKVSFVEHKSSSITCTLL